MYSTDKLVYLELQKTGGTHILTLLDRYVGGESKKKHHRINDLGGRFMLGSVRNPWDWYVSLWAYGASGQGALRNRTTTGVDLFYYNRILPHAMGRRRWLNPWEYLRMLLNDIGKPVERWQRAYSDHERPELFREWLRLLMDSDRRYDIGEGYGFSPLSRCGGLLTFRYLRLYTMGEAIFRDRRLATPSGIAEFDEEHNRSDFIIRTDCLVDDFIAAMAFTGTALSEEQIASLREDRDRRTNASQRDRAAHYYDEETLTLVAERDAFIIDKYGFDPPR